MARVAASSVTVRGQGMRAARPLVKPAGLRRRVPSPVRFALGASRPAAVVRAQQPQWKSLVRSEQPWTVCSGPLWTAACVPEGCSP
eukprot:6795126-Alexandrium_andersonii.AAC.1